MRTLSILMALAAFSLARPAQAAPRGPIDCPVQAMSAKDRTGLGASMVKDANAAAALTAAHDFIAGAAKPCAKANGWNPDQTDAAVAWAEWRLMADELQREAGLAAADVAIIRAYLEEDMTRGEGLDRLSSFQRTKMFDALRQRGAHLHDSGDVSDHELEVVALVHEMRVQELAFKGS